MRACPRRFPIARLNTIMPARVSCPTCAAISIAAIGCRHSGGERHQCGDDWKDSLHDRFQHRRVNQAEPGSGLSPAPRRMPVPVLAHGQGWQGYKPTTWRSPPGFGRTHRRLVRRPTRTTGRIREVGLEPSSISSALPTSNRCVGTRQARSAIDPDQCRRPTVRIGFEP
jgi:hypothetical protein